MRREDRKNQKSFQEKACTVLEEAFGDMLNEKVVLQLLNNYSVGIALVLLPSAKQYCDIGFETPVFADMEELLREHIDLKGAAQSLLDINSVSRRKTCSCQDPKPCPVRELAAVMRDILASCCAGILNTRLFASATPIAKICRGFTLAMWMQQVIQK